MRPQPLEGRGFVLPALAVAPILAYAAARAPLAALAAAGGALLLALIFVWADAALLLLVGALPWEDALRYPTETLSAVKLLGFVLAAAWLLRSMLRREPLRLPATVGLALAFGILIGVSLIFSPDPGVGGDKALRYALFIAFLFLIVQLVRDRAAIHRVLVVLSLSAAGAALWGLVAFLQGESATAQGPIADPNDFAYLLVCVLPIVGYLFWAQRERRALWGGCGAVVLAGLLATLSRGALLGLAALVVWAVASRQVKVTGVLAALATLGGVIAIGLYFWAPLINERVEEKAKIADQNAASRLAFWSAAVDMSLDRPLTGVGPARFGEESESYLRNRPLDLDRPVVHNSYLEVLAEAGIFAFAVFLLYLGATYRTLASARRRASAAEDAEGARLATALQATVVVAIVSGTFLSQQLALPFWLAGGLACALASTVAPRRSPASAVHDVRLRELHART